MTRNILGDFIGNYRVKSGSKLYCYVQMNLRYMNLGVMVLKHNLNRLQKSSGVGRGAAQHPHFLDMTSFPGLIPSGKKRLFT